MFQSLYKLKNKGVIPSYIFDIGANNGNWTYECLNIFPTANYKLFEASDYSELNRYNGIENIEVYKNIVLYESEKEVQWYEMRNTGDSIYREKTCYFKNCNIIVRQTRTLDSIIDSSSMSNILIKIDCQGSEIPILKGAPQLVSKTDFIILEIPFFGEYNENVPNFLEHIKFMDSIGFIPYTISDTHESCNFLIQIDMMFINKSHPLNRIIQEHLLSDH